MYSLFAVHLSTVQTGRPGLWHKPVPSAAGYIGEIRHLPAAQYVSLTVLRCVGGE